jgi:hypothetical protein
VLAAQDSGDLAADRDHLVAVVGVGGHVHVGAQIVKHGEVVHRERAHAARAGLPVTLPSPLEPRQAMRQRRRPQLGELSVHSPRRVGVNREGVATLERLRTALDAVAVGLEVHPPGFAGDQLAIVGVQRLV